MKAKKRLSRLVEKYISDDTLSPEGKEVTHYKGSEIRKFLKKFSEVVPYIRDIRSKYGDMDDYKEWSVKLLVDSRVISVPCDVVVRDSFGCSESSKGMKIRDFLKSRKIKTSQMRLVQVTSY